MKKYDYLYTLFTVCVSKLTETAEESVMLVASVSTRVTMIFKEKHGRYRHDFDYYDELSSSACTVITMKYTDHHSNYELVAIMRQ